MIVARRHQGKQLVNESFPVNEDGNVSSEPELAADSSGEEGQGNVIRMAICVYGSAVMCVLCVHAVAHEGVLIGLMFTIL